MFTRLYVILVVLIFTWGLGGCLGAKQVQEVPLAPSSQPLEYAPCVSIEKTADFYQKTQNLLLIFDSSASMSEYYQERTKFDLAKHTASCMNETIPEAELSVALRTFGGPVYTALIDRFSDYSTDRFAQALTGIISPDGVSPLGFALKAAVKDLQGMQGNTAVVIISDGKQLHPDSLRAANKLKSIYPNSLCIYSILIGDDLAGDATLQEIALTDQCGFSVLAKDLVSTADMQAFVRKILYQENDCVNFDISQKKNVIVLQKDYDGKTGEIVVNTGKGSQAINSEGFGVAFNHSGAIDRPPCKADAQQVQDLFGRASAALPGPPKYYELYFESDSVTLLPDSVESLEQLVASLRTLDKYLITIKGHTDRVASDSYNLHLSQKRADTISSHLIQNGMNPDLIEIAYYGEQYPHIQTADGVPEPKNRRVEVVVW